MRYRRANINDAMAAGNRLSWQLTVCVNSTSERGKKTRQKEEEVGRQYQGMDRLGVCQVPEGSEEQGKMEETGREIICGAPMILAVKGNMRS